MNLIGFPSGGQLDSNSIWFLLLLLHPLPSLEKSSCEENCECEERPYRYIYMGTTHKTYQIECEKRVDLELWSLRNYSFNTQLNSHLNVAN